jgi:hypothetical protein
MKLTLIAFFVFCASSAFGQALLNSNSQPLEFGDHVARASQHDLASPSNLLQDSAYSYAQGERPLWEFGPTSQPVPLGDVARAYREQHALAKKAQSQFVLDKYVADEKKKQ